MWQVIDSTGHVLYSTTSGGIGGSINNPFVPYASSANTLSDTATTKTQIEYLSAATGTTGTTSSNLVFSASPTFTGNVTFNSNVTYTPTVNASLTGANQRIPSHTTANIVFTNASLTSIGSANNGGVSGGHTLCITNETGGNLTIVNNYASAAAGEAIFTGLNGDIILPNHSAIWLQYDSTASAWTSVGGGLIPVGTGISGLGSGIATWLATPSSANLYSAMTTKTGSSSNLVFADSPTFITKITTPELDISGTAGAGFINLVAQSSNASAPSATGSNLFADSVGRLSWARKNGTDTFVRSLAGTFTADHVQTMQDTTDTFVYLNTTDTLTNKTLTNAIVGTQSAGDNSTKAASTAYVQQNDYFVIRLETGSSSPADATTYYFGNSRIALQSTAANVQLQMGFAFTVVGVVIDAFLNTTSGSTENATLQLRNITAGTSTSIGTFKTNGSATNSVSTTFTGLSINVAATDNFCLQFDAPTYSTNPIGMVLYAQVICKRQ